VEIAVETRSLRRVYASRNRELVALDGVDLAVRRGECFGVLGPNGAGKTTLIKILVTLLLPSSGEAYVDGLDVVRQVRELRPKIAMVSGGENVGFGMLKVREQLWMFSQFYGLPSGPVRRRIDELLEQLNLAEAGDRFVRELSSGMRQKMNLIRGLITNPKILFLDEPTVALDVGAARDVRNQVRRWMQEDPNRTVILTTHYMLEADELCDRVAIINRGTVIAQGTPTELKQMVQQEAIVDLQLSPGDRLLDSLRAIDGVVAASVVEQDGVDRFSLLLANDAAVAGVMRVAEGSGRQVRGMQKREATLEDAFVRLVGRSMTEEEGE
jgi:ABC-2 type transport system ATP-binding protein